MSARESLRAHVVARVGRLDVDVELETGAGTLVVVGPNGAGKTTLLSLLLGALPVERGRVTVGASVLHDTDAGGEVPIERRRLGYVPQDYALFPHLSVRENVAFAIASAPDASDRRAQTERCDATLADLGLTELADRSPRSLSGGEQQRVALARALSVGPRALLLDEPLAALDVHARGEVRGFLATTLKRLVLPTIVVTHDAADARALAHRMVVLEAGRVRQVGTWDELARDPASRFVEALIASA
ncbi:MAG: ABC transporter ATP-binding protein [Polyangiales bacterium]